MTYRKDPSFSRVEIKLASRDDILSAALALRELASDLEFQAGIQQSEYEAVIIARHRIKKVSQLLRNGEKNAD